jgi:hypothetical protein
MGSSRRQKHNHSQAVRSCIHRFKAAVGGINSTKLDSNQDGKLLPAQGSKTGGNFSPDYEMYGPVGNASLTVSPGDSHGE